MAISFNPFGKNKKPNNSRDMESDMYEDNYWQNPSQENLTQNNYQNNNSQSNNSQNSFLGFTPRAIDGDYQNYSPNKNSFQQDFGSANFSNSQQNSNQNSQIPQNPVNYTNSNPNQNFNSNQGQLSNQFNNSRATLGSQNTNSNFTIPKHNPKKEFTDEFNFSAQFSQKDAKKVESPVFETPKNPNPFNISKIDFANNSKFKEKPTFGFSQVPEPKNYANSFDQNPNFASVQKNSNSQNPSFSLQNTFPKPKNRANGSQNPNAQFSNSQNQFSDYSNNYQNSQAENQLAIWQNQNTDQDYNDENNSFQKFTYNPNPYQKKSNKKLYIAAFTMLFVSATIFTFTFNSYQQKQNESRSAVAGVMEKSQSSSSSSASKGIKKGIPILDEAGYAKWIEEKNKVFVEYSEDLDGDGLTNGEEFLLGTNPLKDKTCDDKTDVENLVNLVDPAICKPMDLGKDENIKKFSKFINIPKVKEEFMSNIQKKDATIEVDKKKSVLQVFEVATFTDLDKLNPENIKQTSKLTETKLTYLEMVTKIQKYIQIYRSQDAIDRNYATPVHAAVYLDVALKYDVPLKYMLSLARSESRFGTDRFDSEGNLTRPGEFKNIYSIGLDDSGNNKGFATWEDGVEGFGKWYQKFHKRGVSDCSKWRIYNPNGDYCAKVEALSNEIQIFLDKK